jgi:hypothetical protein
VWLLMVGHGGFCGLGDRLPHWAPPEGNTFLPRQGDGGLHRSLGIIDVKVRSWEGCLQRQQQRQHD